MHPKACETSDMETFLKTDNGFKLLTVFAKSPILDVWLDFEYASGLCSRTNLSTNISNYSPHAITEARIRKCFGLPFWKALLYILNASTPIHVDVDSLKYSQNAKIITKSFIW